LVLRVEISLWILCSSALLTTWDQFTSGNILSLLRSDSGIRTVRTPKAHRTYVYRRRDKYALFDHARAKINAGGSDVVSMLKPYSKSAKALSFTNRSASSSLRRYDETEGRLLSSILTVFYFASSSTIFTIPTSARMRPRGISCVGHTAGCSLRLSHLNRPAGETQSDNVDRDGQSHPATTEEHPRGVPASRL